MPPDAEDIHAMSLANLDHEYCAVVTADALLGSLDQSFSNHIEASEFCLRP
ncbi:MAG TPA: hypothetical protein VJ779_04305 [Acetobacteraceae bacterium]|nr:hypothetical protein [Acetobacteraceae bacterium]